jgi:hypothetical protein
MGRRVGRDNAVREWVKPGDFLARKLVKDSIGEQIEDLRRRVEAQEFTPSGAPSLDYLSGDIGTIAYRRGAMFDPAQKQGTERTVGIWETRELDVFNECVVYQFTMPDDYRELVAMLLLMIPDTTETVQFDVYSNYGATGDDYDQYAESLLNETLAVTQGKLTAVDLSGVFTSVEAGHHCAVEFVSNINFICTAHLFAIYEV